MKKKKLLSALSGILLTIFLTPAVVFAADADGNGYDDGEEALIAKISEQSVTMSSKYKEGIDWEKDSFWGECLF